MNIPTNNHANSLLIKATNERGIRSEAIIEELFEELVKEGKIQGFRKATRKEDMFDKKDFQVYLNNGSFIFLQVKSSYDKTQLVRNMLSAKRFIACIHANDMLGRIILKDNLLKIILEMQIFLQINELLNNATRQNKILFYHRLTRQLLAGSTEPWLGFIISFGLYNSGIFLVPPSITLDEKPIKEVRDRDFPQLPLLIIDQKKIEINDNMQNQLERRITIFINEQRLKLDLSETISSLQISDTLYESMKFFVDHQRELDLILKKFAKKIKKLNRQQ